MQKMMEDGKMPEMPRDGKMPFDEEIERTTKAEDVEAGEKVNAKIINLSEHTTNITITEPGTYTLTGEFGNTVLINASGDVVLNLDNAKVENKLTAGSIILSHNGTKHTADSLDMLIKNIKAKGYKVVKVSELIYQENYTINLNGTQIKK